MVISLSTGSLYHLPLQEIFEIGREAGFEGMEVLIAEGFSKRHPLDELLRLSEEVLPVKSIHTPFLRFRHWRGRISSLKKAVKWAKELGAEVVTFHPPNWLNFEFRFWQWMRWVKDFQAEVGQGVAVAIENMPLVGSEVRFCGYFWSKTERLLKFAREKNLYLTFDTTHMGTRKMDIIPEFLAFYETGRVKNIHFSDWSPFREHRYPGKGLLPLSRFLNLLGRIGYGELLTVELTPKDLPKERDQIVAALEALTSYIKALPETPLKAWRKG